MSNRRTYTAPALTALLLLLLPALYVGSYVALVKRSWPMVGSAAPDGTPYDAKYKITGSLPETIFAPAHWADRLIRPGYWYYDADLGQAP